MELGDGKGGGLRVVRKELGYDLVDSCKVHRLLLVSASCHVCAGHLSVLVLECCIESHG